MSAEVLTGLRRWSAGSATDAAAVELLALVARGRLLQGSAPWVRPCGRLGWFWLDPEPLVQLQARLVGADRHLVALVVALLTNGRTRRAPRPSGVEVAA
jgi:hypothetical protein